MTPDPESAWLPVPVERSGGGGDIADGPVIEAQPYGYHGSGLTFSLNAQLSSLEKPLVKLGVPAQQQAYLPGLVSLSSSGYAMTSLIPVPTRSAYGPTLSGRGIATLSTDQAVQRVAVTDTRSLTHFEP